ncbi:hypothetical protein ACFVYJ_02555 [Pontibacter sp. JAM-7]|uniref:hypothetical protein n=1 Tax=Pontibacter sp. JAM-7 TaxID=3366581 RepID=UPI003AF7BD8C
MSNSLVFLTTLIVNGLGQATPSQLDDWSLITAKNGDRLAITRQKDTNHNLVYRCFREGQRGCAFILQPELRCRHGKSYPTLVSNGKRSQLINAICAQKDATYNLVMKDYKTMQRLILDSNHLGIAIPLAQGQFRTVTFPVKGALNAFKSVAP